MKTANRAERQRSQKPHKSQHRTPSQIPLRPEEIKATVLSLLEEYPQGVPITVTVNINPALWMNLVECEAKYGITPSEYLSRMLAWDHCDWLDIAQTRELIARKGGTR